MSAYYNANLAWEEQESKLKIAERRALKQVMKMVGYDIDQARGSFVLDHLLIFDQVRLLLVERPQICTRSNWRH
jgi:hypothetical protein